MAGKYLSIGDAAIEAQLPIAVIQAAVESGELPSEVMNKKTFIDRGHFSTWKQTRSRPKLKYLCEMCNRSFSEEKLLQMHITAQHTSSDDEESGEHAAEIAANSAVVPATTEADDEEAAVGFATPPGTKSAADIAAEGITTPVQFNTFMGAVMKELSDGSMDPQQGNAVCNASKQMLRMLELQYRYRK